MAGSFLITDSSEKFLKNKEVFFAQVSEQFLNYKTLLTLVYVSLCQKRRVDGGSHLAHSWSRTTSLRGGNWL